MGDSRSLHFQSDSKGIGEKDIAANGKSARYETILLYISEGSPLTSGHSPCSITVAICSFVHPEFR